ncbi:MAG: hypothetical protein OXE53_04490 [Deltaproteobacteria bacterium]|nr:hypothetical protein [Deltaproteobacteria bacterium]
MNRCLAVIAISAPLALAACGGGSSGQPATPGNITLAEVNTASPNMTLRAADTAATSLPAFGSVTQSSNRDAGGVSTDSASTTFDGQNIALTVTRENGNSFTLDVAGDAYESRPLEGLFPGYRSHLWHLLDVGSDTTRSAFVAVNWDDSDPAHYLAGGYWIHLTGNVETLSITDVEIGAFADGPEISLSNPPIMPALGSAQYAGTAHGLTVTRYGTDFPSIAPGTLDMGEFYSTVALTADFADGTIGGCMGCADGIEFNVFRVEPTTGDVEELSGTMQYRVILGPTSFDPSGKFRSTDVTIEHPQIGLSSSGVWGGRFSNVPADNGDPRLIAGTVGGNISTPGGSEGSMVGLFVGTKQ